MRDLFFSEIFKLGVFISRSTRWTNSVVITPEELSSGREELIFDRLVLQKDKVHLTPQGANNAGDLIRKAVLY